MLSSSCAPAFVVCYTLSRGSIPQPFLFSHCLIIHAGALFPAQAILYGKVIDTFQQTGDSLTAAGNFWALMWFILALVVAMAYLGQIGLGLGLGGVYLQRTSGMALIIEVPS